MNVSLRLLALMIFSKVMKKYTYEKRYTYIKFQIFFTFTSEEKVTTK